MGRRSENNVAAKKKIRPTTRPQTGAVFMLRCAQLGLSDEALAGMTMGMVYDMLAEQANDSEEYPYMGTREDARKIFG